MDKKTTGTRNEEDLRSCYKLENGNITLQPALKCTQGETDDRMMVHINHAITIENYLKVTLRSSDTDVLVNLMFHFTHWQFSKLQELWMLSEEM